MAASGSSSWGSVFGFFWPRFPDHAGCRAQGCTPLLVKSLSAPPRQEQHLRKTRSLTLPHTCGAGTCGRSQKSTTELHCKFCTWEGNTRTVWGILRGEADRRVGKTRFPKEAQKMVLPFLAHSENTNSICKPRIRHAAA